MGSCGVAPQEHLKGRGEAGRSEHQRPDQEEGVRGQEMTPAATGSDGVDFLSDGEGHLRGL